MLEINNLSHVAIGRNKEPLRVLEQVNFMAPGGHVLAVIGPSGSGKTTLLRVIAGLAEAEAGSITLRGRDVLKTPLYANQLGWVPAGDDGLIEQLSVRENLMSAAILRGASRSRDELLSRVSHVLVTIGLENIATERTADLALPQRRRLKLGLALVADPVIVLCDRHDVPPQGFEGVDRLLLFGGERYRVVCNCDGQRTKNHYARCKTMPHEITPHVFETLSLVQMRSSCSSRVVFDERDPRTRHGIEVTHT